MTSSKVISRRLQRQIKRILFFGVVISLFICFILYKCETSSDNSGIQHNNAMYSTKYELIILVISGPKNMDRRKVIRETWLSIEFPSVAPFFVIGTAGLTREQILPLERENKDYSDLILLSSVNDEYNGLTNKVAKSFEYVYQNFAFKYLLKADDDTFVRLDVLLHELSSKSRERLYWGFFDGRATVQRQGQWAEHKWVLCDKYLPHARGGGYILSRDLVSYIVNNLDFLQLYNSEDISVGAWLGPLNIERVHDPRFDTEYASRGCRNEYIVTHKENITTMKSKWNNLIKYGKLCSSEYQVRPSYVYNWDDLPSKCCIRDLSVV